MAREDSSEAAVASSPPARFPNAIFEQLLLSWFQSAGLVGHQIESFNRFLGSKLQEIVTENSEVLAESERGLTSMRLIFDRVFIRPPALREADGTYHRITPYECRLRGLSYNVAVYVNVLQEVQDSDHPAQRRVFAEVLLCRIPCMVGSIGCSLRHGDEGECGADPGGYFIVNGNEKSVVAQEKMRTNFVFVRRTGPRNVSAEIRSLHALKTRSTSTLVVNLSARAGLRGEILEVRLPFVEMAIPAGVLFKLLGFETLHEICEFIAQQSPCGTLALADTVQRSLDHALLCETRACLVEYLGREGTKEATAQRRARYTRPSGLRRMRIAGSCPGRGRCMDIPVEAECKTVSPQCLNPSRAQR